MASSHQALRLALPTSPSKPSVLQPVINNGIPHPQPSLLTGFKAMNTSLLSNIQAENVVVTGSDAPAIWTETSAVSPVFTPSERYETVIDPDSVSPSHLYRSCVSEPVSIGRYNPPLNSEISRKIVSSATSTPKVTIAPQEVMVPKILITH